MKPMGEKDLTEKILEDYDDVFADIMNGLLFNGEQIINPQNLENASVHSQYKAEGNKLHEQERDTAKYWNGPRRIRLAVLGFENQTATDSLMPVRVFSYSGASQLLCFSFGAGYYLEDGTDCRLMLQAADGRMYEDKKIRKVQREA